MIEKDPNGKQPHEPGAKLDSGKSPLRRGLLEYFPRACLAVARVSAFGASKYAWRGWESVPEGISRYGDAELRHAAYAVMEGPYDKDSGELHASHEAWNALARLELIIKEMENVEQSKKSSDMAINPKHPCAGLAIGHELFPVPGSGVSATVCTGIQQPCSNSFSTSGHAYLTQVQRDWVKELDAEYDQQ